MSLMEEPLVQRLEVDNFGVNASVVDKNMFLDIPRQVEQTEQTRLIEEVTCDQHNQEINEVNLEKRNEEKNCFSVPTPWDCVESSTNNNETPVEEIALPTTESKIEAQTTSPTTEEQESKIEAQVEEITSPTAEEQESKIESLANNLAVNLQREHECPLSIFNFDEFELEQQERHQHALLQAHHHQQQLDHTQYLNKQEVLHRSKRTDLTILTAVSPMTPSNYAAFQSPGGNGSTNSAGQAWYYTDATPIYQNRSGSPCTRKDRLYEAMPYQYMEQEFLKGKYGPRHRHQPAIVSKAALRRVEDNKDDFFQRLYDVRKQHTTNKIVALLHAEVNTAQVVNTVHPRVLTAEERLEVSNRLINHKAYTNRKSLSKRSEFSHVLKEKQNECHVRPKSQKMVSQLHRKALSEIFDVLLVTAQMQREQVAREAREAQLLSSPSAATYISASVTDTSPTGTHSKHIPSGATSGVQHPDSGAGNPSPPAVSPPEPTTAHAAVASQHSSPTVSTHQKSIAAAAGVPEELDTSLAQAHYLQPKQLSDAMEVILASLAPRCISREQFIEFTLHCMNKTYLLQRAQQQQQQQEQEEAAAEGSVGGSQSPPETTEAAQAVNDRSSNIAQPENSQAPPFLTPPSASPALARCALKGTTSSSPGTPKSTAGKSIASSRSTAKPGTPTGKAPAASAPVVIPPIGYLLVAASTGGSGTSSQRERDEGTQEHREYKTHFTGKPHLVAQKTTEKLAKQRYPQRAKGAQKIEDSLMSYAEYKRNSTLERSLQLEQAKKKECTFQPDINTPYMVRYKSAGRQAPPGRNVNSMIKNSFNIDRAAAVLSETEAGATQADFQYQQQQQHMDFQRLRQSVDSQGASTTTSNESSLAGHQHQQQHLALRSSSSKRLLDTRPMMIVQDADGHYGVPLGPFPFPAPAPISAPLSAPINSSYSSSSSGSKPLRANSAAQLLDQKAYLGFRSRRSSSPANRPRRAQSFSNNSSYGNGGNAGQPTRATYAPMQMPAPAPPEQPSASWTTTVATSAPLSVKHQLQKQFTAAPPSPPPPPLPADFVADLSAEYGRMDLYSPGGSSQRGSYSGPDAESAKQVHNRPSSSDGAGRFSYSGGAADILSKLSSPNDGLKRAAQAPLILRQNSSSSLRTAVYQPYKPVQIAAGAGANTASSPRTPVITATATPADFKLTQDSLHRKMYQDLYYNTP